MKRAFLILAVLFSVSLYSQEYGPGNVIPEYGKTFKVENPDFKTDTNSILKVVFDVDRSFEPSEPNKLIETAARFLNMHENAGVEPKQMKVALVLHGNAVFDVLLDKFYTEEFPQIDANPNLSLLKALTDNGVEVILCGQSAAHYKIDRDKTHESAKFALSAMTALVQLQNENYRLIKF